MKNTIKNQEEIKEKIEKPMNMNYRESYAWQLGYDMGWKQAKEKFYDLLSKEIEYWKSEESKGYDINFIKGLYELRENLT